jgi:hypothetical protein
MAETNRAFSLVSYGCLILVEREEGIKPAFSCR